MRLPIAALLGIVVLVACQKSAPPAAAPGSLWLGKMTLTTTPAPPVSDQDVSFQLHLTDANGAPVKGAKVTADLVMITMDMGKNEVRFAEKGNGDYQGTGKFTMAGPWNVVITASAQGQSGQQTTPLVVSAQ